MNRYDKLTQTEIKEFLETAQDFFHLVHSFGWNENITNFVNVWMLEDPIKLLHTITCRPCQIYFHENLFFPDKDNKLHNYKKLTNGTLETLLNELFSLDQEKNKCIINECIEQRRIQLTWLTLAPLGQSSILVYLKLVTLDSVSLRGEKKMYRDNMRTKHLSLNALRKESRCNCFLRNQLRTDVTRNCSAASGTRVLTN